MLNSSTTQFTGEGEKSMTDLFDNIDTVINPAYCKNARMVIISEDLNGTLTTLDTTVSYEDQVPTVDGSIVTYLKVDDADTAVTNTDNRVWAADTYKRLTNSLDEMLFSDYEAMVHVFDGTIESVNEICRGTGVAIPMCQTEYNSDEE